MKNKKIFYIFLFIISLILIIGGFGYLGYNFNYQAKAPVTNKEEVKKVLYLKNSLKPGDEITSNDIGEKEVPTSLIGNALTDINTIIGYNVKYCVKDNYTLPSQSFLYLEALQVCDFDINTVNNNLLYLDLSNISSFNTYKYQDMYDYVDINIRMLDENNKVISEKFIENIPIVDIYDENGLSIYKTLEETKAKYLLLDTESSIYELLMDAKYMRLEITPILKINSVHRNQAIVSTKIRDLIVEKTIVLPIE